MISLPSCIDQGRKNVFALEERIIAQDFVKRGARAKELKHVHHPYALSANAWSAAALAAFDGDS